MPEYDVEVNEFYVSVRHSCPIYTGIECEIACITLLYIEECLNETMLAGIFSAALKMNIVCTLFSNS